MCPAAARPTSLWRAILWFGVSYGVALVGYLLLNAAAGRWLGPARFGYFVVALSVTGVVATLGLVGSHRSGLREAARLRGSEQLEALAELRAGVRAVGLTTLPLASVCAGGVTYLVTENLGSATQRVAMAISITMLVLFSGHQKLWANYLRGFGYVRFASILEGRSGGAWVSAMQAGFVALVWLLFPTWGLAGALGAVAAGYILPIAWARHVVHGRWKQVQVRTRLLDDLRHTLTRDWRFASVQVAVFLNAAVELWIAGLVLADVETSMFSAGHRLAMLLVLPMTSLQVVFSPVIARLAVSQEPDSVRRMERLLRTAATLALALTLVIWLPMLLSPGRILELVFGEGFAAATAALLVLSAGYVVNVVMGLAGLTLSMSGSEGVAAKVQWAGVLLRPLVGVPAAMYGGVLGLALSTAGVSALVFVTMWIQTRRVTGVMTHATLRPDFRLLRKTSG